jgi:hypothetical protein
VTTRTHTIADWAALTAIASGAFLFDLRAGERGFFPLDQSMVFDAGYRIFSGQVPYRDFVLPYGVVPPALQALAFATLGVSYLTYLCTAAAMNALAAMLGALIVRLLFPGARALSYIAAVATAVWFYPPYGTPSFQQTSFLFGLLALAPLLAAATGPVSEQRWRRALLPLAGSAAALAILCKQNTGAYMLPGWAVLLAVAGAPSWRRIVALAAAFGAGFAGTLLLFVAVVWLTADLRLFVRHFIELPATIGELRLGSGSSLLADIALLRGPRMAARLSLAGAFVAALISAVATLRVRPYPLPGSAAHCRFLAAAVCLYLIAYQQLFLHTTNNAYENGLPFIGIIVAVGAGLLLWPWPGVWPRGASLGVAAPAAARSENNADHGGLAARARMIGPLRAAVWLALLGSTAGLLDYGRHAALERWVHDMFAGSSFPRYLQEPKLEHLRWGQPTAFDAYVIPEDDVVAILRFLRADGRNFFVFPDFTLFYGILGKPSPQPLVWFQKGITYPATYDAAVDRWVVDELRRHGVEIVVIEARSWSDTRMQLAAFPQLRTYMGRNFEHARDFGIFRVYERRSESGPR